MNARTYLIFILNITILHAMEQVPTPTAESMATLVSSDGKEFKVPLEIAEQAESYKYIIKDSGSAYFAGISGEVLAEIVQLMRMLYNHKNLSQAQIIDMAEKEIPIQDNYEFAVAVEDLSFKPGIAFISKKIEDYSFPKDEYDYYMNLIQELNSAVYEKLKKCESLNGKPCLEMDINDRGRVIQGSDTSHEFPILLINPKIALWDEESQKNYLQSYLELYKEMGRLITIKEQKTVMGIIKDLAPSLYEAIVEVDPSGSDHIKRGDSGGADNIAIEPSEKDGLPVIHLGSESTQVPIEELRFSIAHEIGHYALGHLSAYPTIKHKALQAVAIREFKKGKKVAGQLPFERSFRFAFTRIQESEADRFAIIEFGIAIDDAIASEKRYFERSKRPTFKSSHPIPVERIKQLEDLRREVELNKARGWQPKPINWKELAAEYLKEGKE